MSQGATLGSGAVAVFVLVSLPGLGQFVSGSVTSVAIPDQNIQLTLTGTQSCLGTVVAGSIVTSIHEARPDGNVVVAFPIGVAVAMSTTPGVSPPWPNGYFGPSAFPSAVTLFPGAALTWTYLWPSNLVQPLYYLKVIWGGPGGQVGTDSYPVMVATAAFPNLHPFPYGTGQLPRVGQTSVFMIYGGACGGFPYFAAISNSTNTGIPLPGGAWFALDAGTPFFDLSFPSPHPSVFTDFQGSLGWFGAGTISLTIPNLPVLAHLPIAIQAAMMGGGTFIPTNPLTFTILP